MTHTVLYLLTLSCLSQVYGQQRLGCTTICQRGHYCKDDDCLQCSDGYYMTLSDHTQQFCLQWTRNSGRNVAIIKNGSTIEDVVWGCKVGYEKKNTLVGGFECLEIKNDHSTENASTTTPTTTSTSAANATTITPFLQTKAQKTDIKNIVLPAVLVTVAVIILLGVLIMSKLICYPIRRNNRKQKALESNVKLIMNSQEAYNKTLNMLFDKIVQVIGIYGCKTLFLNIEDQSNQFNRKPTLKEKTDCYDKLKNWHSLNPNVDHNMCLLIGLSGLGYKFPEDINNINDLLRSIEFHEKLNSEFRTFCSELCKELGPENSDSLLTELELKEQYGAKLQESRIIQVAFSDCLAKWSYNFPYIPNENKDWMPLTKIRRELIILNRNDIIEKLSNLVEKIHRVMITFDSQSEFHDLVNNDVLT